MRRFVFFTASTVVLASASVGAAAGSSATAPVKYTNCTQLNQHYPHGVGRSGAVDHVARASDPRVRNFTVDTALYNKNSSMDRDHDGIACEKR